MGAKTALAAIAAAALQAHAGTGLQPVRMWKGVDDGAKPWVENVSRPIDIRHGLAGRHIALWASHGRYYDRDRARWRWQRPNLFCTNEDLFTQTIVTPYLIPMLENAGAVVFTPRERDWQTGEAVVDNDGSTPGSFIVAPGGEWKRGPAAGFAWHRGTYHGGENPFAAGTTLLCKTTRRSSAMAELNYHPNLPAEGRYAVYVSYPKHEDNVDDARYTVWHKGVATEVEVNQRMGHGTWVYIGTYDFDMGEGIGNRVTLTNKSRHSGVVTADAVRFGGGMGNIDVGGGASGLPRALEGARYHAQWSGAPRSVYASKGADDYSNDINARPYMVNWVGGGSPYMPSLQGLGVPIELSLGLHSDAGYAKDFRSTVGCLGICTTDFNQGRLNTGASRLYSKDFATMLAEALRRDMAPFGGMATRGVKDANYSETRNPEVPSAILEMLSHQNFPDMRLAQDPAVKFAIARSIYKTVLRFVAAQHGKDCAVQPLAPTGFAAITGKDGKARLSWRATPDPVEPTAAPTHYILYTAAGSGGFDNGRVVKGTACKVKLTPGVPYRFKVAAANTGGESFATPELPALFRSAGAKSVLVVDGFERLAAPAVVDTPSEIGFDIGADPGVQFGPTLGWAGRQTRFSKAEAATVGEKGLGYGGDELAGKPVAGNSLRTAAIHAEAIARAKGGYNISGCTLAAAEGPVDFSAHHCIDLAFGLQKHDYGPAGKSALRFKTFTPALQRKAREYAARGGGLLVSGAYVGADMASPGERQFMEDVLKAGHSAAMRADTVATLSGLGLQFPIQAAPCADTYAATKVDALEPAGTGAFCAIRYKGAYPAAVAYSGPGHKAFTAGFPIECIADKARRNAIFNGILKFLMP